LEDRHDESDTGINREQEENLGSLNTLNGIPFSNNVHHIMCE
jgi:hypothetical protein